MGRTDAELIAASRAGQADAFGEIVERYQRAVVAVAYAAVRDRVLAEDIAQDAFVLAWSKLSTLRDSERLPAWLCGIARNVARARRRVRGREVGQTDVAGEVTPFTSLDDAEREAAVAAALARVPAAYREPLVLVYCEQQSAKEVARALGTSDAAVHQRLSRGRALLARDAELVEHAGSRSRRDLAAAVLGAIGVGIGSSSRVEASPRPRGTIMWKLAAVLLATGAAGTTAYVATRATPAAGAQPVASSPQAVAPSGDTHAQTPARAHAAEAPSLADPHAPPHDMSKIFGQLAPVSPKCAEVASHLTDVSLENPITDDLDPTHLELAGQMMRTHFEQACASQQWSAEFIACALAANDPFSMHFDCKKFASADQAPPEHGGFSFERDPNHTVPAAADFTCAAVGQHLVELHRPNAKELAQLSDHMPKHVANAFAKHHGQMGEMIEADCAQNEWTEARRKCIAAATTVVALAACD